MSSAALSRTLADAAVAASRERERRDDLATYVVSDAIARGADASVDAFEAFYLDESSHRSNARTGGPADRSDERTSLSSLVRRRVGRVASRFRRACGFEAETHADVELWFVASARARAFLARGSADAEASRRGAVNVAGVPVPPSLSGRSEHHSEEDADATRRRCLSERRPPPYEPRARGSTARRRTRGSRWRGSRLATRRVDRAASPRRHLLRRAGGVATRALGRSSPRRSRRRRRSG